MCAVEPRCSHRHMPGAHLSLKSCLKTLRGNGTGWGSCLLFFEAWQIESRERRSLRDCRVELGLKGQQEISKDTWNLKRVF